MAGCATLMVSKCQGEYLSGYHLSTHPFPISVLNTLVMSAYFHIFTLTLSIMDRTEVCLVFDVWVCALSAVICALCLINYYLMLLGDSVRVSSLDFLPSIA